jgi:hypothetical protein
MKIYHVYSDRAALAEISKGNRASIAEITKDGQTSHFASLTTPVTIEDIRRWMTYEKLSAWEKAAILAIMECTAS